jgi:hypothetical protein
LSADSCPSTVPNRLPSPLNLLPMSNMVLAAAPFGKSCTHPNRFHSTRHIHIAICVGLPAECRQPFLSVRPLNGMIEINPVTHRRRRSRAGKRLPFP